MCAARSGFESQSMRSSCDRGHALENGRAPTMLTSWPLAARVRSDAYPTCALPSAAICARTPT